MSKGKKKAGKKLSLSEKAFVAWLKHDPLVNLLVVQKDEELRRDIMLHFLGPKATSRYYGKLVSKKHFTGPVLPQQIREEEKEFINFPEKRDTIVKKLIYWATDKYINARYVNSHQTRKQVVASLLGPMFLYATPGQEMLILAGVKRIAFTKDAGSGKRGEQSFEVNAFILDRIRDILVHNQQVIIAKTVAETEEKMRAELLRAIQNLKEKKFSMPFWGDSKITRGAIPEKFPLRSEVTEELERLLEGYRRSSGTTFQTQARAIEREIEKIRRPFTLTTSEAKR